MSKTVNKTGEIIRMERKRLKLSQEALGELIGCCRQTVSSFEKGDHIHDEYFITEMSKVFDCDVDYLRGLQAERHRSQTDIKAITGLSADTIKALSDLYKQASYNSRLSDLARKRITTINALLVSMLSDPRDSILDNMYDLIDTLSRIKAIESSDLYNMSEVDILQTQLNDPDKAEALDKDIKACETDLDNLRKRYKIIRSDFTDRIKKEIEKIDLR